MLILNKNGIYAQGIDGLLFQITKDDEILDYIHDSIKQEGDVTFGELMNILEPFADGFRKIYKTIINGCNLELFFEESKMHRDELCTGTSSINFNWSIMTCDKNYFNIVPKIRVEQKIRETVFVYKPLTLIKLNNISDLQITLDEHIQFEYTYKKIWNMYDLVEALLYEICIFKNPEERNTRNKMILKNIEDSEKISYIDVSDEWENIEYGILLEEADINLKTKELAEALDIEDYETAAVLKRQIDELETALCKIKNPTE